MENIVLLDWFLIRRETEVKRLLGVLLIIWIGFIFYQGTRSYDVSMKNSQMVVEIVKETVSNRTEDHAADIPVEQSSLMYLVRKSAHVFEYGMLALLMMAFRQKGSGVSYDQMIEALFVVLLCATVDEYLQSFVGRGSNVRDVLIDLSGGLGGVSVYALLRGLVSKIRIINYL